ncbi:hypothetical protein [Paenibacillus sp. FSL M7-1046]|uniref:hypothetical protein n=1 Tax=Paenibacillus sp. FSL M7-1046 TaxID=2975315 RepID=UPI0030F72BC4
MDEALVIQQHFDFSFDVLSASAEEFHYVYRLEFSHMPMCLTLTVRLPTWGMWER